MARFLAIVLSAWVATFVVAQDQQPPPAAGSDGVPVPRRVRSVQPVYPPEAAAAGLRGIVVLELTIDTAGKVVGVRVVRSVPPFDEAAVAAAHRWEYEPVTVAGRPSPVRLTVPVTFSLRLPEVDRQPGIPELRAGGAVQYPANGKGKASAAVTLTVSPSGDVLEVQPVAGEGPFVEALQGAARSWRFAGIEGEETASFRLEGVFSPGESGSPGRVDLRLTGFQRELPVTASAKVAMAAQGAALSATSSAPSAPPVDPSKAASPSASSEVPTSSPAPDSPNPQAGPTSSPSNAPVAAPSPDSADPQEKPQPAAPGAGESSGGSARPKPGEPVAQRSPSGPVSADSIGGAPAAAGVAAASPNVRPSTPAVETVSAPPPPTRIIEAGASAIRDIRFDGQVPDLVRGRRPVSPPLARVSGVSGDVTVSFSVDAAGITLVRSIEGPEIFKKGTQDLVASWVFRRLSPERIFLSAVVSFKGDTASAVIRPQKQ
jgi:TonB family protein